MIFLDRSFFFRDYSFHGNIINVVVLEVESRRGIFYNLIRSLFYYRAIDPRTRPLYKYAAVFRLHTSLQTGVIVPRPFLSTLLDHLSVCPFMFYILRTRCARFLTSLHPF